MDGHIDHHAGNRSADFHAAELGLVGVEPFRNLEQPDLNILQVGFDRFQE
jgi:hypothetical protein